MQELVRNLFVITISVLVVLLIGDYLGYKLGRRRLGFMVAICAIAAVIVFAVYAAINI